MSRSGGTLFDIFSAFVLSIQYVVRGGFLLTAT